MFKVYVIASKASVEKIYSSKLYLMKEVADALCDDINEGYVDWKEKPFKVYPLYLTFDDPYSAQKEDF